MMYNLHNWLIWGQLAQGRTSLNVLRVPKICMISEMKYHMMQINLILVNWNLIWSEVEVMLNFFKCNFYTENSTLFIKFQTGYKFWQNFSPIPNTQLRLLLEFVRISILRNNFFDKVDLRMWFGNWWYSTWRHQLFTFLRYTKLCFYFIKTSTIRRTSFLLRLISPEKILIFCLWYNLSEVSYIMKIP